MMTVRSVILVIGDQLDDSRFPIDHERRPVLDCESVRFTDFGPEREFQFHCRLAFECGAIAQAEQRGDGIEQSSGA